MKKVDKNLIKSMCSDLVKYRNYNLYTKVDEKKRIGYINLYDDLNEIVSRIGYIDFVSNKDDIHVLFLNYPLFNCSDRCGYISFKTIDELISCISNDLAVFDFWNQYKKLNIDMENYGEPCLSDDELQYAYGLSIRTGRYLSNDEIKRICSLYLYVVADENDKPCFTGSKQKCEQFIKSLKIRKVGW